jgi:hypothetical protein
MSSEDVQRHATDPLRPVSIISPILQVLYAISLDKGHQKLIHQLQKYQEEMPAIHPLPQDKSLDAEWRACYEGMLDNIKEHGYYKPQYKHGKLMRGCNLMCCGLCSVTTCLPCCIWDTVCFSSHVCCRKACCWGLYCICAKVSFDNIYEQKHKVRPHIKALISKSVIQDVCKKYLIEFDCCVAARNPRQARTANGIRAHLVEILKQYHAPYLEDDGNIDKLRNMVYKEM